MIQKPLVPPPIIFIGCTLIMAYLPNPYPLSTNVLIAYLMVLVSSVIAFFSLWEFYKSKANINPIHLEKSDVFVVNGIYRFSRNPMYLSLAGLLVAWAVYLQSAQSTTARIRSSRPILPGLIRKQSTPYSATFNAIR
jgi:protein-S-isoprenylcysteine O-methyltransferase Ste14